MKKLKICEYVKGTMDDYKARGPINIAIIGDSVSHGSINIEIGTVYDTVYHNRLRLMINTKYPVIPVNIINTAVGGTISGFALQNFDRDILPHKPDLVIICFGHNDVGGELDVYKTSLSGLFEKCRENDFDCIFMTPNMLNTYVSEHTEEIYAEYAKYTAEIQNNGKMDNFMATAKELASSYGFPVCDCYAEWKKMYENGIDTTELLANYINHPTREMHKLFADKLYETIFGEKYDGKSVMGDDGMIKF